VRIARSPCPICGAPLEAPLHIGFMGPFYTWQCSSCHNPLRFVLATYLVAWGLSLAAGFIALGLLTLLGLRNPLFGVVALAVVLAAAYRVIPRIAIAEPDK
jgi:hypothetical protein